jgi:cbb3-type cytochrome oxidase cytochrome c subunit
MLGVPYGAELNNAAALAETQAQHIAAELAQQGGPAGLDDREVIALIAYMQRLGTDIKGPAAGGK